MSNFAYLLAASSSKEDFTALATSERLKTKCQEDLECEDGWSKRSRRRVVYGEDLEQQAQQEKDSNSPELQQSSSPEPEALTCSQEISRVITTVFTSDRRESIDSLPDWSSWLSSFPRLPYWVTSTTAATIDTTTPLSSGTVSPSSHLQNESYYGWKSYLRRPPGEGLHGAHSPPADNHEETSKGMVAYLLVASGEDVRHEDIAVGLFGDVYQCVKTALPTTGSSLLQFMIGIVSLSFIGHLGLQELASSVLAVGLTRVTGHVVLMGLGGALEVFYSQASVRENINLQMLYFLRALLLLTVACLPISVVWCFAEPLLVLMKQEEKLAHMAGKYVIWLLPSLIANAWIQAIIRYLQVQNYTHAMDICAAVTLMLHIPTTWLLVHTAGFGFLGAAMATSVSYGINFVLLGICACFSPSRTQFSAPLTFSSVFEGSGHFIRLCLPSTVIACVESWGVHALILMAGLLPNPEMNISIFAILLSSFFFAFTVAFGFGSSLSLRISKNLGAGRPRSARNAAAVGLPVCAAVGILLAGTFWIGESVLPKIFSSDPLAVQEAICLIPLISIMVFLDAIQEGLIGIVRGCGQHSIGALINLSSDVLGIVSAIYFTFILDLRIMGLILGMIVGILGQSFALACVILSGDWADQSMKALRRVEYQQAGCSNDT